MPGGAWQILHADDRSGHRYAGGGVQVRLCQAGFDGVSHLLRVMESGMQEPAKLRLDAAELAAVINER